MEKPIVHNITECPECKVPKGWGEEIIITNNELYCGKLMRFKEGAKFSMHYHMIKDETWYVQKGAFQFDWIDTENGKLNTKIIVPGQVVYIQKGLPHQLTSLIDNSIVFEVSTEHFDEDSYRVYRNGPQDLE